MISEFDRGFVEGLTFAAAAARVSARHLYARGAEKKWQAAGDALSEIADGFNFAAVATKSEAKPPEVAPPIAPEAIPATAASAEDLRHIARAQGYTGDICNDCQNMTMVRNGTCLKCETCGSTTGCS